MFYQPLISNHKFSGLTCFQTSVIISAWGNASIDPTKGFRDEEQCRNSVLKLKHKIRAGIPTKLTWLQQLISLIISSLISFRGGGTELS